MRRGRQCFGDMQMLMARKHSPSHTEPSVLQGTCDYPLWRVVGRNQISAARGSTYSDQKPGLRLHKSQCLG